MSDKNHCNGCGKPFVGKQKEYEHDGEVYHKGCIPTEEKTEIVSQAEVVHQLDPNQNIFYTKDQIDLIQNTVAKGSSVDELKMFLHYCKMAGVDPLRKQAHFIKRNDGTVTMMIGIDGFQARATQDPRYLGIQAHAVRQNDEFEFDTITGEVKHKIKGADRGKLVGAYAVIQRKGMPNACEWVDFHEYDTGRSIWKTKPEVMITKVARATLLRREYPDNFSGVYVPEEFGMEITDHGEMKEDQPSLPPADEQQPTPQEQEADVVEVKDAEVIEEDKLTLKESTIERVEAMPPREALALIYEDAFNSGQLKEYKKLWTEVFPDFSPEKWPAHRIPEPTVIKFIKEATDVKLSRAEQDWSCKKCDANITEPERDEQDKMCRDCYMKEED